MKKSILASLVAIAFFTGAAPASGSEEKDHVCFSVVDANEDGQVTYEEFKAIFGDKKVRFQEIDTDDDGALSHEEYHQSLGHGAS